MKKKSMIVFMMMVVLGIGVSKLYGLIYYNDIVCFFNDVPEKQDMAKNMIEGSNNFLKAHSEAFKLLSVYEMSELQTDICTLDATSTVKNSILYIGQALINFENAISIGKKIGYNESKMNWFTTFDYEYLRVEKGLNAEIYSKVKYSLQKGDVLGLYQQNITNLKEITNILVDIRDTLNENKKPSIDSCWKLLQKLSEATLWGNYATIIGNNILQNCPR